jgi:hypothetical protein
MRVMTSSISIRGRRLLAVGLSVAAAATLAVGAGTAGSAHSHSIQADSCKVVNGQKGICG